MVPLVYDLVHQTTPGGAPADEDRYLIVRFPDGGMGWALADGLSGGPCGDRAAEAALEILEAAWRQGPVLTPELLRQAHDYVQLQAQVAGAPGMAAAVTAVLFLSPNQVRWAHIGSNRLYLLRGGSLHRLTRDHTAAALAVERGFLTPEVAPLHPDRFVLYQAVGGPEPPVPDLGSSELQGGDLWVLVSDGAVDSLSDDEIAEEAVAAAEPAVLAERLLERAERLALGNATVIAARFSPKLSVAPSGVTSSAIVSRRYGVMEGRVNG